MCSAQVDLTSASGLRMHRRSLLLFRHFQDAITCCMFLLPLAHFTIISLLVQQRNYYEEIVRNDKAELDYLPAHPVATILIFTILSKYV